MKVKAYLFQKGQSPHNLGARNKAKLKGEPCYVGENPCPRGHFPLRNTVNGSCVECCKENAAKKRSMRTHEEAEKDRAYARENIKKWQEKTKSDAVAQEKIREHKRRWKLNNIGAQMASTAKRRASKIQRTPLWMNKGQSFEIECVYKYCNALRSIGLDYHVDHIVPLLGENVSGFHVPWNLQVIHAKENLSKGNKYHGK